MGLLLIIIVIFSIILGIVILKQEKFSIVFSLSFFIFCCIWYYYPIIASIIRGRNIYPFISFNSFLNYCMLELLPLILIQAIVLLIKKPYFNKISKSTFQYMNLSFIAEIIVIILSIIIIFNFWVLVGFGDSITYLENNALLTTRSGSFTYKIIGSITLLKDLLFGYLYALILADNKKTKRVIKVAAIFIIMIDAYTNFTIGSRVQLLVPLVILIYYAAIKNWSLKYYLIVGTFLIISFIIGGSFAVIASEERTQTNLSFNELIDTFNNFRKKDVINSFYKPIFDELLIKYDSISSGGFLVNALGPGSAGFKPYYGSVFSLIPRFVFPEKPVPGSIDDTYWGTPQRLVPNLWHRKVAAGNHGVSPVCISVWQSGYCFGVILFIVFNLLSLMFLNSLFRSSSKVSWGIAFSILNLPSVAYFLSSPDRIILVYQRVIFILLMIRLLSIFISKKQLKKQG